MNIQLVFVRLLCLVRSVSFQFQQKKGVREESLLHSLHFQLMRLLFQFYEIDSVYLSSLQSKKCLLKSGKVSSSDGPSMPFGWSVCARYTGIHSPPSGHRQPLCWAINAHNAGNECPNIGLILGNILLILCDI